MFLVGFFVVDDYSEVRIRRLRKPRLVVRHGSYETLQARVQELEQKLSSKELIRDTAKLDLQQMELNAHLKDKIQSLEQDLRDYKWEWEQACERERNRKDDIQSLEARLALVTELNRTRGYPTGQEWADLIKKLKGETP